VMRWPPWRTERWFAQHGEDRRLTELLAAIPSVIYGLWAVFVLVPLLRLGDKRQGEPATASAMEPSAMEPSAMEPNAMEPNAMEPEAPAPR